MAECGKNSACVGNVHDLKHPHTVFFDPLVGFSCFKRLNRSKLETLFNETSCHASSNHKMGARKVLMQWVVDSGQYVVSSGQWTVDSARLSQPCCDFYLSSWAVGHHTTTSTDCQFLCKFIFTMGNVIIMHLPPSVTSFTYFLLENL